MNRQQNRDKSAFPVEYSESDYHGNKIEHPASEGLTKREYFAGLAMQGMLSNPELCNHVNNINILYAVKVADELLKALDNE